MTVHTSGSPINGVFPNLLDGLIISTGQTTHQVSYSGGYGNDLTLTVLL